MKEQCYFNVSIHMNLNANYYSKVSVDELREIRIVATYWKAGQSHLTRFAALLYCQHSFYESSFSVGLSNKGNTLVAHNECG